MIDIDFYMKFDTIYRRICEEGISDPQKIYSMLEECRNSDPIIYNIETTNRCNMRCKMCPRTHLMTRQIEDINVDLFCKIADQLAPHSETLWKKWCDYCEKKYGISENDSPSENHFFLYVISRVVQLHGFGEPVLDKNISKYIEILTERNIESYLSTNPINADIDQTINMMSKGLTYIKYCFDSTNDIESKNIRGNHSDFSNGFEKVLKIIEKKESLNLKTIVVITMINLAKNNQQEEYEKLNELFSGKNVYLYLKSENSQWYRGLYHGTQAIHGTEICKHPWMSLSVKSNGEVAMCMDDYNNEIILGNTNYSSLKEIWNGDLYKKFRLSHIIGDNEKCSCRCDLPILGEMII